MARPYTAEERKALKQDFLQKYEESNGLTYATCQKVGISAETLSNWREKDKKFDKAIKEIDERVGDMVIGKLMESILRGDRSSIYFWLKCRKHWSETHKVEVEQKGEMDIKATLEEIKKTLEEDDE